MSESAIATPRCTALATAVWVTVLKGAIHVPRWIGTNEAFAALLVHARTPCAGRADLGSAQPGTRERAHRGCRHIARPSPRGLAFADLPATTIANAGGNGVAARGALRRARVVPILARTGNSNRRSTKVSGSR